ncbi:hypothetical protein KJ940_02365, partial [Myxococcota bacterium]|nr:hypothetical protein [Myxococcota bacterium]
MTWKFIAIWPNLLYRFKTLVEKAPINTPKVNAEDYIQWLIASPRDVTCTEASRTGSTLIAHDAYTHLLGRLEPDPDEIWNEVKDYV